MKLEDHFTVLRVLGQGGFGKVLHVRDKKTGQEWAAKVLLQTDADSRRRFVREVEQLVRYRNFRHVIRVARGYLEADPPYFLMPLAKGGTLSQHVGRLSQGAVVTVMRQLMETLVNIHHDGGIHRDVKPDNIFLPGDGTSALGDFGCGNSPECTIHFTLNAMGTPGYAAPELMNGADCTPGSDVFSAGATWFHVVTGRHPRGLPLPLDPRAYGASVPETDAEWILLMTDPNPWRRPSAMQVYQAVAHGLQQGDHPLPKEPPPDRRGWFAAGAGLLLLAVIIAKVK